MRLTRQLAAALIAVAAAVTTAVASWPAAAASPARVAHPATGAPHFPVSGSNEADRTLAACGGHIYAGGSFTRIQSHGQTYTRDNLFSFLDHAPWTVTSWNPGVNGQVMTITLGDHCTRAYIGGTFTSVHGTAVHNIAEVSTTTGQVIGGFAHSANAAVNTLLNYRGHILAGGAFTSINGHNRAHYDSLSPVTGKYDGWTNIVVSGTEGGTGSTMIYSQVLNHAGGLLLLNGDFSHIGSSPRREAFMLRLVGPKHPALTGWTTPGFAQSCIKREAFWARGLAWSTDDSTAFVASTGFQLQPPRLPLSGMCDTLTAIPTKWSDNKPDWSNYTGCDSLYSVIEAGGVVFAGGHERWAQNRDGCNHAGPGAYDDPGLGGFNPSTGHVLARSRTSPDYWASKDNAYAMITDAGHVIIGSTNRLGSDMCQGVHGVSGFCILPIP